MASNSGFQPLSANPGISSFLSLISWPGLRFLKTSSPGCTICDFDIVRIFAKIAYTSATQLDTPGKGDIPLSDQPTFDALQHI
jgi:hypothetical protein